MELSSRQIIALAAPVVITYLTWSTVGGKMTTLRSLTSGTSAATSALKRPEIAPLTRNPFAPAALKLDPAALLTGDEDSDPSPPLRLDGTAVAGRWRMAIINGQRVFEGQTVGMMRVQSVATDGVTLLDPGGRTVRLTLDIAPAPATPKPGEPAAGTQAERTPIEAGLDALKSGGGGDVLESLGIPRS